MYDVETIRKSNALPWSGWVRVPLPGNPYGIMLLLPPEPLTAAQWEQFMRTLEAMRPGLVDEPRRPVAQAGVDGG